MTSISNNITPDAPEAFSWAKYFNQNSEEALILQPLYLDRSAWLDHIPFAFWLIATLKPKRVVELGTHRGVSYFAMCQAIKYFNIQADAFAVDTWKGDEHAGFYDEDVYKKVNAHNGQQYASFSRLVRSDFNEAVTYFEDQSIDLLHIDGLHTYEAVKNDFETWLPKLSKNAIVIFHDINVRERGFGVFKLFGELKQKYPFFEFTHGHGLGVLKVGQNENQLLDSFLSIPDSSEDSLYIKRLFSHIGSKFISDLEVESLKKENKVTRDKLKKHEEVIAKKNNDLKVALNKAKESDSYKEKLDRQVGELAKLANAYSKKDSELLRKKSELNAIKGSTSWKISYPVRAFGKLYKRLKK